MSLQLPLARISGHVNAQAGICPGEVDRGGQRDKEGEGGEWGLFQFFFLLYSEL